MAGQYDNNMTGVLFVNDKKGNDRAPDWRGSAEIEGKEYWVSGWAKAREQGDLISLRYELKDATKAKAGKPQERPQSKPQPAAAAASYEDDIPF